MAGLTVIDWVSLQAPTGKKQASSFTSCSVHTRPGPMPVEHI